MFPKIWKWLGQPGRNVVLCKTDCWCGETNILYAKNILFLTSFQTKKNHLKIALQVSRLGFSPIVMPQMKWVHMRLRHIGPKGEAANCLLCTVTSSSFQIADSRWGTLSFFCEGVGDSSVCSGFMLRLPSLSYLRVHSRSGAVFAVMFSLFFFERKVCMRTFEFHNRLWVLERVWPRSGMFLQMVWRGRGRRFCRNLDGLCH